MSSLRREREREREREEEEEEEREREKERERERERESFLLLGLVHSICVFRDLFHLTGLFWSRCLRSV